VDNVEADRASRVFNDNIEWTLDDNIFKQIVKQFGQPKIDMFASRLNNKLDNYCAWLPDPYAKHVDAFTVDWSNTFMYMFPPFSLMAAVLAKIRRDRAEAVVVMPLWITQSWISTMSSMLVDHPVVIPVTKRTLFLPQEPERIHPLAGRMKLLACRLCGDPSRTEDFRRLLPLPRSRPGGSRLTNNIHVIHPDGTFFVNKGKLIMCMRQFRKD